MNALEVRSLGLLVFHSNYVPILHCLWDMVKCWLKMTDFNLPHLHSVTLLGWWHHWNFMKTILASEKCTHWAILPPCMCDPKFGRFVTILAWIRQTDRETDRKMGTGQLHVHGWAVKMQQVCMSRPTTTTWIDLSWLELWSEVDFTALLIVVDQDEVGVMRIKETVWGCRLLLVCCHVTFRHRKLLLYICKHVHHIQCRIRTLYITNCLC